MLLDGDGDEDEDEDEDEDGDGDGDGDGRIEGADLDLSIDFFGHILTEADDVDIPDFPWVTFLNTAPTNLDFRMEHASIATGGNPFVFDDPDILGLIFDTPLTEVGGVYVGSVFVVSVSATPLPAGLPLLAAGAGALALLRRRKAAS